MIKKKNNKFDFYLDENLEEYLVFKKSINFNFNKIKDLFFKLLKILGNQNWWPTYYTKGFNKKIEILIGAVLTQNTSWKQVEKSLKNLAEKNLLNFNLITEIDKNEEKIKELIRPSGFINRKVKTLKEVLKWFKENYNKEKSIKQIRKELLDIKGVGKETADSIILYVFEKPIFIIDNYTKKFFYEHFNKEIKNYDLLRIIFESSFLDEKNKVKIFKEYHALIVEYGKRKNEIIL
jgi:endonuclease-3 related protein